MKQKFLVAAPPYGANSAGIVVLHELCNAINRSGHDAYMIVMNGTTTDYQWLVTNNAEFFPPDSIRCLYPDDGTEMIEYAKNIIQTGIVIYPETVIGNPLGAKNVARYFLNRDGAIAGTKSGCLESDFTVAYCRTFYDSDFVLCLPVVWKECNDIGALPAAQRSLDLTYIGKGEEFGVRVPGSVLISRHWPKTKDELAAIFRSTRYLYSFDHLTSTNIDAFMCGAILVLMRTPHFENNMKILDGELGSFPYVEGVLNNGKVGIVWDDGYWARRDAYLESMQRYLREWDANVATLVQRMIDNFSSRA